MLDDLSEKEHTEKEQIDDRVKILDEQLHIFDVLYSQEQAKLLSQGFSQQILSNLSEIEKLRKDIRAAKEDSRMVRSSISEYYEKERKKIEAQNCDAGIQAIYEAHNREKKEFEETLQIARSQENHDAESAKKELEKTLEGISAMVDNCCKITSHISAEIANENRNELELFKLRVEAVEKYGNLFLARNSQEHEQELAEKKFGLDYRQLLLAENKQENDQRFEWLKYRDESELRCRTLELNGQENCTEFVDITAADVEEKSDTEQKSGDSIKIGPQTKSPNFSASVHDALISKYGANNK